MLDDLKQAISEAIQEAFGEMVARWLEALRVWLIDTSYFMALVGGSICILLYAVGWEKGGKAVGILIVIYVLLKVFLG